MAFTFKGIAPGRVGTLYESETINYLFLSDNKDDEAVTLFQNPNCPRIWSKHPQYRWMFCSGLTYEQGADKEWIKWTVSAEYKPIPRDKWPTGEPSPRQPPTRTDPNEPPDDQDEPVDFEPKVRISFEEYAKPVDTAFNAQEAATKASDEPIKGSYAIVHSNLEQVDPPPEKIENNAIIDITRNVDWRDAKIWNALKDFRNAINTKSVIADDFKVRIAPKCARLRWSAGTKTEYTKQDGKTSYYIPLNVQLIERQESWLARIPDIGSYAFSVAGTKTIEQRLDTDDWSFPVGAEADPFYDEDNNRITKLLDGQGNELSGSSQVINEWRIYREKDFSSFLNYLTDGDVV